jgi:hypothetical protein
MLCALHSRYRCAEHMPIYTLMTRYAIKKAPMKRGLGGARRVP